MTTQSNSDRELEDLTQKILNDAYKGNNHCFLSGDARDVAVYMIEYMKQREAALLSRIKEEIIGEDKDPDTTGRGFRDGHTTRENKLRAEQRTKLDNIAKEIRGEK